MSFSRGHPLILTLLPIAMASCSSEKPTVVPQNADDAPVTVPQATAARSDQASAPRAGPVGRWIGVEGMYLEIKRGDAPGRYRLAMQWNLDDKGRFEGMARGDTIEFMRDGVRETLRPTDGDATGLKYLAGKKDCLTAKVGEGYCRD